ncbi:MAG: class I SAM-dependent DNA methyltransferase, partial [Alphaproteobacteria bacterium]|nr:class I SAM-dependent DNA methyltransferase [Alphaproteobacteria bacterium]
PDELDYHVAEKLAELRDGLYELGYPEKELEKFLMRLVFCLFAADSGIFDNRSLLFNYLRSMTRVDGHDFGMHLELIYKILNREDRSKSFIAVIKDFPYVNGGIFEGSLPCTPFNLGLREIVLDLGKKNWRQISPIIFGTLFESVMEPKERREFGAHYTSEENILRVLAPLFLDELRAELSKILESNHQRSEKLVAFEQKLRGIKILDPACGCGSFLLCAFEQIRKIELESILARRESAIAQKRTVNGNPDYEPKVNVDQFFGIELNPTAQAITEAALWMIDQLQNTEFCKLATIQNRRAGDRSLVLFSRIPITAAPTIVLGDALELDWETILPATECSYIIGNPPFVGAKMQQPKQREQVRRVAGVGGSGGTLDFVAAWFIRATDYNQNGRARIGFVATNSIVQGEQVAQLWPIVLDKNNHQILFAHQTFAWQSPLKNAAAVHCVIIGLNRADDPPAKRIIFYYDSADKTKAKGKNSRGKRQDGIYGQGRPEVVEAISPYLFDASGFANPNLVIAESSVSLNGFPEMLTGSKPIDNGNYIFNEFQLNQFLLLEPRAKKFIHPFVGAHDLINGHKRWVLALQKITSEELRLMPLVAERVERVRVFRQSRNSLPTVALAATPTDYHINQIPDAPFLAIPVTSSERRHYVPITWLQPPIIPSVDIRLVINAPLWLFAIITSRMHMVWLRTVGGRLESRYRYSIGMVYNTFPLPPDFESRSKKLEPLAQEILDIRAETPESSLATLYDPKFMTSRLTKAHQTLDRAVDRLYDPKGFETDQQRLAHLFALYQNQWAERV